MTIGDVLISDLLHNCAEGVCGDIEYAKGIFVGVVIMVMALRNNTLDESIEFLADYLPNKFDHRCLPDEFIETFNSVIDEDNQ